MSRLALLFAACLAVAGCADDCVDCKMNPARKPSTDLPQMRSVPAVMGDWERVKGLEDNGPTRQTIELQTGEGPHGLVWSSKKPMTGNVLDASGKSIGQFTTSRGGLALPAGERVRIEIEASDRWAVGIYRFLGKPIEGSSMLPPDLPEFRK
jgi:hypothetical protein